jgi:phosphoenolpyruvate synthase/pyruvate phosphate dikinase
MTDSLNQISKHKIAGNKANNLSKMIKEGFSVP